MSYNFIFPPDDEFRGDPRPRYSTRLRSSQGPQQPLQKQDYEKIKNQCLKDKRLFEDPHFRADDSILYKKPGDEQYVWERPKKIVGSSGTPEFFVDGASQFDIKQRILGDCWMLASMSCLTMRPELMKKIVPDGQNFTDGDYAGIFRFKFWSFGEWVDVVIDDQLPTNGKGSLVYTGSSQKNEFWTALLEKAYAKLYGSYEAIISGRSIEAMEDFTGGIGEVYKLQSVAPSNFGIWSIMVKAHERKSLMCCATEPRRTVRKHLRNGLVAGHAYSVTRVMLVNTQALGTLHMVRVRNPWGDDDEKWIGDWSDDKQTWNQLSEAEQKVMEYKADKKDGEFWMTYKEFVENFEELHICHLDPESFTDDVVVLKEKRWETKCHNDCWKEGISAGGYVDSRNFCTNPQYGFEVVGVDEGDSKGTGTVIIALMQKDRRRGRLDNLHIGYTIYKLEKPLSAESALLEEKFNFHNYINKNAMDLSNPREVCDRHALSPGSYCVIPFTINAIKEAHFILRIFTEKPVKSKELDEPTAIMDPRPVVVCKPAVKPAPEEIQKFSEMSEKFMKISGDDLGIDAYELQGFLNQTFANEFKFGGFSPETCRSLVALEDIDRSGKLGYGEFMTLWNLLQKWTTAFKKHDEDGNGTFDNFELRQALRDLGYTVSNRTFTALVQRFKKGDKIHFDDFIHCMARLNTMCEVFKDTSQGNSSAVFNLDQFLQTTMYS